MLSFGDKRFRDVCLLESNWPPEGATSNVTVVPLVEGFGFLGSSSTSDRPTDDDDDK